MLKRGVDLLRFHFELCQKNHQPFHFPLFSSLESYPSVGGFDLSSLKDLFCAQSCQGRCKCWGSSGEQKSIESHQHGGEDLMGKTGINQCATHRKAEANGGKCCGEKRTASESTKVIYVKCLACSRCSINHIDDYQLIKPSPLGGHWEIFKHRTLFLS